MTLKISYKLLYYHRDVAQFGRALRSGRRGRVFESRHPDQAQSEMAVLFYILKPVHKCTGLILLFNFKRWMI